MREISPYDLSQNPFTLMDKDWTLITAGTEARHNTMTASWGHMGILWNKPSVVVFVRPQRYTHEFLDEQGYFSLGFFKGEEHRPALRLLGAKSGRDGDKIAESGLHSIMVGGVPAFEEASMVLVCRKAYMQRMHAEGFVDTSEITAHYKAGDFHDMYIGIIEKAFVRE